MWVARPEVLRRAWMAWVAHALRSTSGRATQLCLAFEQVVEKECLLDGAVFSDSTTRTNPPAGNRGGSGRRVALTSARKRPMRHRRAGLTWLLLALAPLPSARAQDAGHAFFEKKIRPLLVEHCYACHSAG